MAQLPEYKYLQLVIKHQLDTFYAPLFGQIIGQAVSAKFYNDETGDGGIATAPPPFDLKKLMEMSEEEILAIKANEALEIANTLFYFYINGSAKYLMWLYTKTG